MEILLLFINKFFIFTFALAVLYLLYEGVRFFIGLRTGNYEKKKNTLLFVGIAIAHIITTLITGFII